MMKSDKPKRLTISATQRHILLCFAVFSYPLDANAQIKMDRSSFAAECKEALQAVTDTNNAIRLNLFRNSYGAQVDSLLDPRTRLNAVQHFRNTRLQLFIQNLQASTDQLNFADAGLRHDGNKVLQLLSAAAFYLREVDYARIGHELVPRVYQKRWIRGDVAVDLTFGQQVPLKTVSELLLGSSTESLIRAAYTKRLTDFDREHWILLAIFEKFVNESEAGNSAIDASQNTFSSFGLTTDGLIDLDNCGLS